MTEVSASLGAARRLAVAAQELEALQADIDAARHEFEVRIRRLEDERDEKLSARLQRAAELSAEIADLGDMLNRASASAHPAGHLKGLRRRPGLRAAKPSKPSKRMVLTALTQLERGNAKAIAHYLGADTNDVAEVLSELRDEKLVRGIGQGRYRDYEIAGS